jgi:2-aminoadipate transaminase
VLKEIAAMDVKSRFSVAARRMSRSVIRELLKLANKPELISFAGGLPYPGTFPDRELASICERILGVNAQAALQYSATEGLTSFRDLLVEFVSERGLSASREELIITTASQQSLDLVGKIFVDRGDTVVTENPSYLGAISAFRAYGVRFLPVDMDDQGMKTEQLRGQLAELAAVAGSGPEYYQNMPKFIYTVPDFQNPSGVTMSLPRRRELLDIAAEYDLLIVEDVPYRWLRYRGEDVPMIASLEGGRREGSGPAGTTGRPPVPRRVLSLFTFSKILFPGVRLGWIIADASIIDKLVQAKQATDLCTSAFSQRIAEEYMKAGLLERRVTANIEIYRRKLEVMLTALEEHMPRAEGLSWTIPDGGMFLWIRLPQDIDADEMFKEAIERKVAYVIGSAFHPGGGGHNTLRLNFSYPSEEQIREGIRRLAGLVVSRLGT